MFDFLNIVYVACAYCMLLVHMQNIQQHVPKAMANDNRSLITCIFSYSTVSTSSWLDSNIHLPIYYLITYFKIVHPLCGNFTACIPWLLEHCITLRCLISCFLHYRKRDWLKQKWSFHFSNTPVYASLWDAYCHAIETD